jgi:hypothetical protein
MGEGRRIRLDFAGGYGIPFLGGHFQQLVGIAQAARQTVQALDHLLELGALTAELLCAFRVIPDTGLLELARYFLQPLVLVVVIKDTSSKSRCALRDL